MSLFIGVILVIVFVVWISSLQQRVNILEKRGISSSAPVQTQPQTIAPQIPTAPQAVPQAVPPQVYPAPQPSAFANWLKEDWLLKLGAFLLVVGFGWLTTYAFLHNWVGPTGRIAFGMLSGLVIMGFGEWRLRKYVTQGSVFFVLGAVVFILSVFAGYNVYGFFGSSLALLLMFLATAATAVEGVRYNQLGLGGLALFLAAILPLLSGVFKLEYWWLFSYLLIVVFGVVLIRLFKHWPVLGIGAIVMVGLYSLPTFFGSTLQIVDKIVFAYVFTAIFTALFVSGLNSLPKGEGNEDVIGISLTTLFFSFWTFLAPTDSISWLFGVGASLAFIGAVYFLKAKKREDIYFLFGIITLIFVGIVTFLKLHGTEYTIVTMLEVFAIPLLNYVLTKNIKATQGLCILYVIPGILTTNSLISPLWRNGVMHKDFGILLLMAVVLAISGAFLSLIMWDKTKTISETEKTLFVFSSLYVFALVWLISDSLLHGDTAVTVSLVIYTIAGLVAYFIGRTQNLKGLVLYGGLVLGAVVIRLFVVDVWQMSIGGRIVTFFVVGILFITTAFFGRNHNKPQIVG